MSKFQVGDKVIVNATYFDKSPDHGVGTVHEIGRVTTEGDYVTLAGYKYSDEYLDPFEEETWVRFKKTNTTWGAVVTAENIFEIAQELAQNEYLSVQVEFHHDGLVLVVGSYSFEVGDVVSNEGRPLNQGIWTRV